MTERADNGQFLPGASANPRGAAIESYPRDWRELRALAQTHSAEAIAELVKIMRTSRSSRIRLAAINMLLDRGYGKALEMVDIETRQIPPYGGLEFARRIAFALTQADRQLEGKPVNPGVLEHADGENSR